MRANFPSDAEPWYALSRRGQVFVLTMQRDDNRFDFESTAALHAALDKVEQTVKQEDPKLKQPWALVTTGHERIYSNGLDPIKVFPSMPDFCGKLYHPLLKRMLTFPMPTVAAINGHAFAGGCMFAMAHDYRVMRSDRGFICMNEIDMKVPLTPGMVSIVRAKFPSPKLVHACLLEAHRFDAKQALATGLIDQVAEPEKVVDTAVALAEHWAPKGRAGPVMSMIKSDVYPDAVRALTSGGLGHVATFKPNFKL
ncbi:ClpP/crotonase-like domain-containing protein [Thamnocephalis sphaerospora]|uniref:ClpP/crotonase-like domain-containing protein n=1 Tax=Thamnocephalis sphaerospora TaxID=78915 RepID=A0A4P9XIS8_9FUNG|nr:ClpP/crotonase-like domain-containing protein [Thamnocephalis sphaerospora]|eukprot:RKP05622.1 ClpP/crotonase-like domain-containing protein [Thamnocephalis sphaerospora]